MNVSINWLKEYVKIDESIKVFADQMTMSGSKVEMVEEVAKDMKGIVVGHIEKILPHPNADKLVIVKVNIGDEMLQIVTGATNINEGDYVPVAVHGAQLAGDLKIKKGKLRGEVSEGMLCSLDELGFGKSVIPEEVKDGIWILDQAYPLGSDALEVLSLTDQVAEFEITSNRPDCLSMMGMAREAAATFRKELNYPNINLTETKEKSGDYVQVKIENNEKCPRYLARVIKNVKIGPSPIWLQLKLMKSGVRPINNIVDVTNYVMLEYGQPLHAFDIDAVAGDEIIIRNATSGEEMKTLDGVQRKLNESMLMITDKEKLLAIAGVMGGEESEITPKTTTVLLESANFEADGIRKTSKTLGLRTEASSKYEKGLDPNLVQIAAERACQLIAELGAGEILMGAVDVYITPKGNRQLNVSVEKINGLLGTQVSPEEMIALLKPLEIKAENMNGRLELTIPTFRDDLVEEADIAEEIARMYGYDKIISTMAKGNIVAGGKTNGQKIEDFTKDILNAMGFNEILTFSFVSPKSVDKIELREDSLKRRFVKLLNPLGDETSVMRTTLLPNMLEVLSRNINRNVKFVRAFEMGNIFLPKDEALEILPSEIPNLVMGMYGEEDFFTLKGAIEALLEQLGIEDIQVEVENYHPTFHPGRCASILVGQHTIGTFGEIHPKVLENYDIDERCYCAEIDFSVLLELSRMERLYEPLPKYPAITRDFAVVLKNDITVKQIEGIIKDNGGNILESFTLFDIYQGSQIPEGHKSVAYSITYRDKERTLTDDDVNILHDQILTQIREKLEGILRD
ncbi:phenylalanyl-tRNA synthetase, beta subunit [Alkaliphilus metalliredigens QYMF]|uniref:Phenylalanine--tRNA ligase beta subunit n=1 Tax=Alkaliphilus metalliredigens (strain QYMF) TaxID=293826 RepID=A6TNP9_ALKMQ|nr:phenylalanine--tRNA ligase subunit beta [Alkaliphilus metalliredigens]ABR47817.1 phenylalanyl-tRNA synthetase, beta subunit [Alkaliphilus metalliredigens QYMF]